MFFFMWTRWSVFVCVETHLWLDLRFVSKVGGRVMIN